MDHTETTSQGGLIERVFDRGLCVACGACVGLCPYFEYFDGRVVTMDRCQSDQGRCFQICPRAEYQGTTPEIDVVDPTAPIGSYRKVFMARARRPEIREKAQYGGTVSAILTYALEKNLIESAILTDQGGEMSPAGAIARNPSDALLCAGSRYTASGGLAALNRAIQDGEDQMAVVGLPCQMEALARLKRIEPDGARLRRRITLGVGLFCTWAIDFRGLRAYLTGTGLTEPVRKYDIPPPPAQVFRVLTDQGWEEFPLEKIRPFILKGCSLCQDMTAEWADISVGTVEGLGGWNTVLVRTGIGEDLLDSATRDGILEMSSLPAINLEHLKEASRNKRGRGRANRKELIKDIS